MQVSRREGLGGAGAWWAPATPWNAFPAAHLHKLHHRLRPLVVVQRLLEVARAVGRVPRAPLRQLRVARRAGWQEPSWHVGHRSSMHMSIAAGSRLQATLPATPRPHGATRQPLACLPKPKNHQLGCCAGLTCSLSAPTSWSMGRRATWRVAFLNWVCPSLLGSCSCRIINCSTSASFRYLHKRKRQESGSAQRVQCGRVESQVLCVPLRWQHASLAQGICAAPQGALLRLGAGSPRLLPPSRWRTPRKAAAWPPAASPLPGGCWTTLRSRQRGRW